MIEDLFVAVFLAALTCLALIGAPLALLLALVLPDALGSLHGPPVVPAACGLLTLGAVWLIRRRSRTP
jgi:MYXO-CTERM domain-containing protein